MKKLTNKKYYRSIIRKTSRNFSQVSIELCYKICYYFFSFFYYLQLDVLGASSLFGVLFRLGVPVPFRTSPLAVDFLDWLVGGREL